MTRRYQRRSAKYATDEEEIIRSKRTPDTGWSIITLLSRDSFSFLIGKIGGKIGVFLVEIDIIRFLCFCSRREEFTTKVVSYCCNKYETPHHMFLRKSYRSRRRRCFVIYLDIRHTVLSEWLVLSDNKVSTPGKPTKNFPFLTVTFFQLQFFKSTIISH